MVPLPRRRRTLGTPARSGSGRRWPCGQDRRVAPDVFVHLIEPADWRAALTGGEVRPPSLGSAGFVHLSTREQVHLPAERLYPGRRDLVLLVVDPARLADPVRFEDGVPA